MHKNTHTCADRSHQRILERKETNICEKKKYVKNAKGEEKKVSLAKVFQWYWRLYK